MSERLKPMLGAYLALYVVAYCGVRFIFAGLKTLFFCVEYFCFHLGK